MSQYVIPLLKLIFHPSNWLPQFLCTKYYHKKWVSLTFVCIEIGFSIFQKELFTLDQLLRLFFAGLHKMKAIFGNWKG